ncbi:MAG: hypothetical protein KA521_00280 [Crocinitomicaceae bacterium]|nr:hypothetical protein [Crocinitomicaceae bacterium]
MLKLFLGNRAGALILLPFIVLIYIYINGQTNYYYQGATINFGFWGEMSNTFVLFSRIIGGVLIIINALLINWIFNTNQFYERNIYLPALLYVVLMSFYHSLYSVDGLLIAHTFLILLLNQLYKLVQNSDGRSTVFNGAFFAGIAATFHPPLFVFIPVFVAMVLIIRPFVLREFLLLLTGFLIPAIYALLFYNYSNHTIDLQLLKQTSNYQKKHLDFIITASLFVLLFLFSLFGLRAKMQKSSIRLKKLVRIIWLFVLIATLLGAWDYFAFQQIERFSFLMIPLSFFLPFSYTTKKNQFITMILFYLTFAYSFVNFFL